MEDLAGLCEAIDGKVIHWTCPMWGRNVVKILADSYLGVSLKPIDPPELVAMGALDDYFLLSEEDFEECYRRSLDEVSQDDFCVLQVIMPIYLEGSDVRATLDYLASIPEWGEGFENQLEPGWGQPSCPFSR